MWEAINQVLEEKVRPQLLAHRGGIELLEVKGEVVRIRLLGQCAHCPSAYLTTEELILASIQEAFPQIRSVVVDQAVNEELLSQAAQILQKKHGNE